MLPTMEVQDMSRLADRDLAVLQGSLAPLRNLGDLLDWARRLEPPVPSPVVLTQDEYTHDVLVPYGGGRWLDFDTT
jgi:hypothetical protein